MESMKEFKNKKLRAENERLKAELAEAKKDAEPSAATTGYADRNYEEGTQ